MSKLIAFGDSFTWGTDLSDDIGYGSYNRAEYLAFKAINPNSTEDKTKDGYSRYTWPALLAKELNLNYQCFAKPGASNSEICRTILKNIDNIDKNDKVIVNWTWIDRWEYFNINTNKWNTLQAHSTENKDLSNMYFKYFHSELHSKLETLKQMYLIFNVLKEKDICYISTLIDSLAIDTQYHIPSYNKYLQDQVKDCIIWFEGVSFYEWSKNNNYAISEVGNHPLEEAHQNAFNYIMSNYEFTK